MTRRRVTTAALLIGCLVMVPLAARAATFGLAPGTYTILLTNCELDVGTCPDVTGTLTVDGTSVLDWEFVVNHLFSWDGVGLFQNALSATESDASVPPPPQINGHTLTISDGFVWNYDRFPGAVGLDRHGTWSATLAATPGNVVPEPATLLLMGAGLSLAAARFRRRP